VICPCCQAPHQYIYFNDGKKRTQLKCKVCNEKFQLQRRHRKSKNGGAYFCPYCDGALFKWKQQKEATIYKCGNKQCPCREKNLARLKPAEKMMRILYPNLFTINYIYREYHFTDRDTRHAEPLECTTSLLKIHNSENILGLVLSLYVSFAISARKTALILRQVFKINLSHQSVLNYCRAASYYCHKFNMDNKTLIDEISVGDETYIKIKGKQHYTWFFISSGSKAITAYHISNSRDTQAAATAIKEAIRTENKNQPITLITDGLASYTAALHYINSQRQQKIKHIPVIGLENLDEVSTQYRPFKQIIERLNRTYKYHVRPAAGFNTFNGAIALTTLFVTHYNFLRPHHSLNYKSPIQIPQLQDFDTIQAKWIKILKMAMP
jgi:transposase-like protein